VVSTHKCRLTLRCTRSATAGFARLRTRVSSNVRRHLVFLALTRAGLDELRTQFGRLPSPLWVNEGLLSSVELAELRKGGASVTNFTYHIAPGDSTAIEGALTMISRHHSGQRIWVERQSDV
jgi:hypothetical protein